MKHAYLTTAAVGLSLLFTQAAFADEETDALKKEIKLLEARINQLEKKQAAQKVQAQPAVAAAPASNGSLEKRLAIVERKQDVAQEVTKDKDAVTPKFSYTPGRGMTFTTPDNQYAVKFGGYLQLDDRVFPHGGAKYGTLDTFLVRSARPVVEAKLTDYFDSRFMIDFGKGGSTVLDAYGDFHPMPGNNLINLRAGEFKVPIGIERWQSESDVMFVERGQTTNLVPYRETGLMAHGQIIPDQLEYQLAVTNGTLDLTSPTNTGDLDNDKDVIARVMVHPLTWSGVPALSGLGIGLGGTYGNRQGTSATGNSNLTSGYSTFGQRTYFAYKAGTYSNGAQWRINPQLTYYNGSFGALGEYVADNQEVTITTHTDKLRNNAWLAAAEYVLTGEDASYDGVSPAHNFDPRNNEWGAFELVCRVSQLNVDRSAFTAAVFADPNVSAREAFETTIGATWFFSRAAKLNLDLSRTTFEGGAFGGANHADEKAVLSRLQLRF